MVVTPHLLTINAPVDPTRNNFRVRIVNSSSADVVNELIPGDTTTFDVAPSMQGQPAGDYTAWVATVGPGGESDAVNAGLFSFFPVPLPVTSATIT